MTDANTSKGFYDNLNQGFGGKGSSSDYNMPIRKSDYKQKPPTEKVFSIITIVIGLTIAQIPLSFLLSFNYTLIMFVIIASIIIGAIIYIRRLPNEQPNSREVKE